MLHGATRADLQRFQLYLHHRNAVDQKNDIIAVVAVVGVDAELVDDLEDHAAEDPPHRQRRQPVLLEGVRHDLDGKGAQEGAGTEGQQSGGDLGAWFGQEAHARAERQGGGGQGANAHGDEGYGGHGAKISRGRVRGTGAEPFPQALDPTRSPGVNQAGTCVPHSKEP